MIDIYKTWIRDFRIDGFRMDTMKHVNDEFWQKFAPAIQSYAKSQGIRDFYMFGEVAEDTSRPITSHYMTHDDVQGVLDFPFQTAATRFAANSAPTIRAAAPSSATTTGTRTATRTSTTCRPSSGTTTRDGSGCSSATPTRGATEDELLARDELAHALMYLSRGNPVVYYGDEQGFTGQGGDQDARQDMFPSQDLAVQQPRPVPGDDGAARTTTSAPTRRRWTTTSTRRTRCTARSRTLAALTKRNPALRNGAQQDRTSSTGAGVYAFSRIDRAHRREYVVALNNAESAGVGVVPTYVAQSRWEKVYGDGPSELRSDRDGTLDVTVAAAVDRRLPGRRTHPAQPPGAVGRRSTCRRAAATGSRSARDSAATSSPR